MKLKIKTVIILWMAILQGCGLPDAKMNENILQENKVEISKLNDQLFLAIKNKDVVGLKNLFSDTLKSTVSNEQLAEMIDQLGKTYFERKYEIMSEYHVTNTSSKDETILLSKPSANSGYKISFQALNKEMYVSLLLLENDIKNKILSTVIYGKYGKEWKINVLRFGKFSYGGKNAIDFYQLALKELADSNIADAANAISLAKECLYPANNFFEYEKEAEINDYYNRIIETANSTYHFPIVIENIETKPSIFKIYPEVVKDGFFPTVYYHTKINLNDTVALKTENELIKKQIGTIFKGIDQDKKFIYYKAVNEISKNGEPIKSFGFIDELTK